MNLRCQNCGHAALDSDDTCFHCGEPLPGRKSGRKHKAREGWRRAGPTYVVIFGGMTLLVCAAAIVVMAALGRQPQLQVRMSTRTLPGWQFLTGGDRAFAVTLPESWTWLDAADPGQAAELADMVEQRPSLRLATHPLGAESDDLTILFAAGDPLPGDDQRPLLVVATSPLLNRLTYQETVDFLAASDYDIQSVRYVDDFDKSHVFIQVETPLEGIDGPDQVDAIRCRQQFVLGRQLSLLISLCAPPDRFGANAATFDAILATFQHLGL